MHEKAVIDVHAHILPAIYVEAMREAGLQDAAGNPVGDGFPFPKWTLDDSLDVMDRFDIAASILSITAPGIQFCPAEKVRALARALNHEMANIVAKFPSRFANLAIIPADHPDAALHEIAWALDTAKFDGIGLYSNAGGRYLGDAFFLPILEELNRRAAVVFIHPAQPPSFNDYSLGLPAPILEYPFDSTRMIASMLVSGALMRFRDIKFIVPHGGGTTPYLAHRIARAVAHSSKGKTSPDEAMQALTGLDYDLTAMGKRANLALLKEFVPASRLLVGYDYPFRPADTIKSHVAAFEAFDGFGGGEKAQIRSGNALGLFPRLRPA